MASKNLFLRGDLVLVDFPNYGYWPCKITSICKNGRRKIEYFGEDSVGTAYTKGTKDLIYYDDLSKTKYLSKASLKKYPNLAKAVKEISVEFQNRKSRISNKKGNNQSRKGGQIEEERLNSTRNENTGTFDQNSKDGEAFSEVSDCHGDARGNMEGEEFKHAEDENIDLEDEEPKEEVNLVSIRGDTRFLRQAITGQNQVNIKMEPQDSIVETITEQFNEEIIKPQILDHTLKILDGNDVMIKVEGKSDSETSQFYPCSSQEIRNPISCHAVISNINSSREDCGDGNSQEMVKTPVTESGGGQKSQVNPGGPNGYQNSR